MMKNSSKHQMKIENAVARLTESKFRITRTRKVILDAIFKLKSPFSANDLLGAIHNGDLVTVYRNLRALEKAQIICRTDFSDEMVRYMISEPGHDHHHHHIVCTSCHDVKPVDFCIVEAQEQILNKLGFKNVSHRLEFSGVCPTCA